MTENIVAYPLSRQSSLVALGFRHGQVEIYEQYYFVEEQRNESRPFYSCLDTFVVPLKWGCASMLGVKKTKQAMLKIFLSVFSPSLVWLAIDGYTLKI